MHKRVSGRMRRCWPAISSCSHGFRRCVPLFCLACYVHADTFADNINSDARQAGHGGTALRAGLSCHARNGRDLSGDAAYVWGMNNHVASAGTCCAMCAAHQAVCGTQERPALEYWPGRRCGRGKGRCNAWVYCPGSSEPGFEGRCFSYDVHVHRKGECWLKHERNITGPIAAGPMLPKAMREAPRKQWPWAVSESIWPGNAPEKLTWVSGIVAPPGQPAWAEPRQPGWYHRFCKKHRC